MRLSASLNSFYLEVVDLLGCFPSCLWSNLRSFKPLFLQIFFLSCSLSLFLLGIQECIYWSVWWCPIDILGCSLFFNFFSFCSSEWLTSIGLSSSSPILSSTYSNLPLDPNIKIFISVTILFSSRILFGFFVRIYVPLLIFKFCLYIFKLYLHLPLVLWVSLRDLFPNLCLAYLPTTLLWEQFLSIYFFSFEWTLFSCFLVCLVIFFFVEKCIFQSNNLVTLEIRFFPSSRYAVFLLFVYLLLLAVSVPRISLSSSQISCVPFPAHTWSLSNFPHI